MRKFTNEEIARIIDLFNKERNLQKIAKIFGHTQKVIKRVLVQNGIECNFNRRAFTKEDDERIIEEYRTNGGNARSIAKKLNVSIKRARKNLIKIGVKLTNRKYTDEFEKDIVEKYIQGKSSIELEKETGIDARMVLEMVKRAGIKPRLLNIVDPSDEYLVVNNYTSNPKKSACQVAREHGVKDHVVRDILERHGIDRTNKSKIHYFNENIFKEINEDVSWFLGWMWSDGNVMTRGTQISVTVHRNDSKVFQFFGKVLEAESYAHDMAKTNCDIFKLNSPVARQDLIKIGCVPCKSLIINWPKINFSKECLSAFLRGLYEGDGSFSTQTKICTSLSLASGSKVFLKQVSEVLQKNYGVSSGNIFHSQKGGYIKKDGTVAGSFKLQHGKLHETYKLLCYMYNNGNCEYYLDRKYQEFLKIKKYFETSFYRSQKYLIRNNNTGQLYYCQGRQDLINLFDNQFSVSQVDTFIKNYEVYHENRKKCGLTKPGIPSHWQLIQEPEKQEILQKLGSFRDILVN